MPKQTDITIDQMIPDRSLLLRKMKDSTILTGANTQEVTNKKFGGISDHTTFDTNGHMTMVGNARPWRDELGDAVSLQQTGPGVSRNAPEATVEFTTSSNLLDYLIANVQLNHDKDLSSSLYPHIHWLQSENHTPNFLIRYRWQTNGRAKEATWTDLKCQTNAYTYVSGTLNQISHASSIVPPVNANLSDILQVKIYRDNDGASTIYGGVADSYTATVGITNFDIHFMINSLGSADEYSK